MSWDWKELEKNNESESDSKDGLTYPADRTHDYPVKEPGSEASRHPSGLKRPSLSRSSLTPGKGSKRLKTSRDFSISDIRLVLNQTPMPTQPRKPVGGPFALDDDSDDDSDKTSAPPIRRSFPLGQPKIVPDATSTPTLQQCKAELLKKESERRRREALAKKKSADSISSTPVDTRRGFTLSQTVQRPLSGFGSGLQSKVPPVQKAKSPEVIDLDSEITTVSKGSAHSKILGEDEAHRNKDLFGEDPDDNRSGASAAQSAKRYDEAQQKAKLEALLAQSNEAAKKEERERNRERESRERARQAREQQLEAERAKKATDVRVQAEQRRVRQAEADAAQRARRIAAEELARANGLKLEADLEAEKHRKAEIAARRADRAAEEQKLAEKQPPKPSVLSEEQQRARDKRIRMVTERNRRLKEDDDGIKDVEEAVPDVEKLARPQPKSLSQQVREAKAATSIHDDDLRPPTRNRLGHVPASASLSNAFGSLAASSTPVNGLAGQVTGAKSIRSAISNKPERPLGQFKSCDANLMLWRDTEGKQFEEIIRLYKDLTGKQRSEDCIRRRFNQVKKAINLAKVPFDVVRESAKANEDAIAQLNAMIRTPEESSTQKSSASPSRTTPARRDSPIENRRPISSLISSSGPLRHIDTIQAAYADHEVVDRPTTGGKTIDSNFLWNMAENMAESYEQALNELDEQSDGESVIDPDNPEDYVHYTYTVHRKETFYEDLDSDDSDEEAAGWVPISDSFEDPAKANAAALLALLDIRGNGRAIADPLNTHMTWGTDQHGLAAHKLVNDKVGEVEVGIKRYLHKYPEKKLPASKKGWSEKVLYKVMERNVYTEKTTTTVQLEENDDLFGEPREEIREVERVVDKESQRPDLTSSLEQANHQAATYFASKAILQQANMSRTDRLRQDRVEELLGTLGEEELFHQQIEDDHGQKLMVWVEKATISGPRNI